MKLTLSIDTRRRTATPVEAQFFVAGETYDLYLEFPGRAPSPVGMTLTLRRERPQLRAQPEASSATDPSDGTVVAEVASVSAVPRHQNLLLAKLSLATTAMADWVADAKEAEAVAPAASSRPSVFVRPGTVAVGHSVSSYGVYDGWLDIESAASGEADVHVSCRFPVLLRPRMDAASMNALVAQVGEGFERTAMRRDSLEIPEDGGEDAAKRTYPSVYAVSMAFASSVAAADAKFATKADLVLLATKEYVDAALENIPQGGPSGPMQPLTLGTKTYDGTASVSVTAGDLGAAAADHHHTSGQIDGLSTALANMVPKEADKGLSSNDYTDADKAKVDLITPGSDSDSDFVPPYFPGHADAASSLVYNGKDFDAAHLAEDGGVLRLRILQKAGAETYTATTAEVAAKLDAADGTAVNLKAPGVDVGEGENGGVKFSVGPVDKRRLTSTADSLVWHNESSQKALAFQESVDELTGRVKTVETDAKVHLSAALLAVPYGKDDKGGDKTKYAKNEYCSSGGALWRSIYDDNEYPPSEDEHDLPEGEATEDATTGPWWERIRADRSDLAWAVDETGVLSLLDLRRKKVVWSELTVIPYDLLHREPSKDDGTIHVVPHATNHISMSLPDVLLHLPDAVVDNGNETEEDGRIVKVRDIVVDAESTVVPAPHDATATYNQFDVVVYNGKTYYCDGNGVTGEFDDGMFIESAGHQISVDDTGNFDLLIPADSRSGSAAEELTIPYGGRAMVYFTEAHPSASGRAVWFVGVRTVKKVPIDPE